MKAILLDDKQMQNHMHCLFVYMWINVIYLSVSLFSSNQKISRESQVMHIALFIVVIFSGWGYGGFPLHSTVFTSSLL